MSTYEQSMEPSDSTSFLCPELRGKFKLETAVVHIHSPAGQPSCSDLLELEAYLATATP